MKFKDTLLYRILIHPVEAYQRMNIYSFILAVPFLAIHFIVGVFLALIIDLWVATAKAGG